MKFPFEMFASLIKSKTTRKGLKRQEVNQKYTSFIGLLKYSYRNDITSNHNRKSKDYSAALTIGRRGLGFKERNIICVRLLENCQKIVKSYNVDELLNQSAKSFSTINNCDKSNWSKWNNLKKEEYNILSLIKSLTVKETNKEPRFA